MPIQSYTDDDTPLIHSIVPLHPDYLRFRDSWTRCRDAVAGEDRIKNKGSTYLPPLPSHTKDQNRYRAYLNRATFYNATSRTLEGLVGAVFRKAPIINNLTATLSKSLHIDNITQDGESISDLALQVTTEVVHVGRVGLLLDRPYAPQQPDVDQFSHPNFPDNPSHAPMQHVVPSISPEEDYPYVAMYKAENILNWRTIKRGRQRILQQVVLREVVPDPMTIGYQDKEQIRVLEIDNDGEYCQYLLTDSGQPNRDSLVYPTNQGRRLNYIPFLFVNPKSLNPEVEKPPLSDIVNMNFSHYRSYAALEHGRAYTAFPQFYVSFNDNDNPYSRPNFENPNAAMTEGPDSANADGAYRVDSDAVWEIDGGRPGILEYQGSGLNSLESALDKKEGQIQALGARLITPLKGLPAQSAVVYELQALGDAAILLQITTQVAKAMNQIMRWMADWEQVVVPAPFPEFTFIASFTDAKITARELRAILALYKEHALPKDALYHTLREAGVLPPSMSLDDFKTLLDNPDQLWQLDDRISV